MEPREPLFLKKIKLKAYNGGVATALQFVLSNGLESPKFDCKPSFADSEYATVDIEGQKVR